MLLSPSQIHSHLSTLTSPSLHTALLISPTGQILSSASNTQTSSTDHKYEDETQSVDEDESGDEPELDEPERLRLILGLASQWGEDESPRMECELGRLYFKSIPLRPVEVVGGAPEKGFTRLLLVLNGSDKANWKDMASKAEGFSKDWAYK